uniref:serine/threonine-protein kinase PBL27-like n=1 Tax=Erigeron canadensis TaxID=72917 RepID=UPI001CB8AEB6|nr:serine/threonine-protein kinase PBL27-like [Erigeron canadensis]
MSFINKEFQHLKISLNILKSATNNFSDTNCIGRGGFGKVYKGEILLSGVLTMVAIKRLDRSLGQGTTEFWKEVMTLSQYKHENLVSLLRFCDEGGENLLVYEYLSNKSLDLYISRTDLTWPDRLRICIGAALGLRYLHEPVEGSQQRVLHRDIKSANILLDENGVPKIADLGLSKLGPANQEYSFIFSNAVGTPGYCDPLYSHTGLLTKESDVYSFGVVLFEVLCGRPAYVQDYNDISRSLSALARKCYEEKKLDTIIHPGIRETISPKSLERFSAIAYQCLHLNREERPSMEKIAQEIQIANFYEYLTYISLPEVPIRKIEAATGNFKMCIWENEHYQVYRGELSISGGKPTTVFIRRFCNDSPLGDAHQFFATLVALSGQQPPNILPVVGYCYEKRAKVTVHEYKYAERGSLDQYISRGSNATLTWLQRLQICCGAARGLSEFHNRNLKFESFKSGNILLDSKWVAKICEYMPFPTNLDIVSVRHVYSAPDYILSGQATREANVYSFGMVLFEVLCGRLFIEKLDGFMLSAQLIKELYEKRRLDEVVDPALLGAQMIGANSIDKYSAIAYRCLSDDPKERPTMDALIEELEELIRIEVKSNDPFYQERRQLQNQAKVVKEREKVAVEREKKMQSKIDIIEEELARQKKLREEMEEQVKQFNEMMIQQRNLPPPS